MSNLVEGRTLPMSIELFERNCLRVVQSIPLDDPLADLDMRQLAIHAVLLCREMTDYRAQVAASRQAQGARLGSPERPQEAELNTTNRRSRTGDPFGIDNDHEAFRLLDLIDAEFRTDPQSVQCFDLRIVERVRQCVEQRRKDERAGKVPPLLTDGARK